MKALLYLPAFLLAQSALASSLIDVNKLNQILQEKHAGWVAKPTDVNSMARSDVRHLLGLKRSITSGVQFKNNQARIQSDLPAVVDWRNKDGNNWVTPVLDQANCGSCVAFASVATLETQYRISTGFPNFNIKLSPQHLFSCGGGYCEMGWMPEDAANYIQNYGVPDESCMPYTAGATGLDVACSASCADAEPRSVRIASYGTPSRMVSDVDSVKQALQHGPLVTTLNVYADFMAYSSGVYKHVTGDMLGGHAVSIVGYDDNQRAFIIRNSWGEGWGESGFAYISYDDESGIGDETWSFTMSSLAGAVTVESPVDYSYFTGSVNLKADSTYGSTDSVSVTFFDQAGQAVWNGVCRGNTCNQAVDVGALADGRYEVQAISMDPKGQQLGHSTRQFFYIANKKPTLQISFAGANDTDLSKPLTDRIEVAVIATSSSVPLSSVEFHYRGTDHKDNAKAASVVIPGMTIGWRTNLVSNGTYDIWMVGHVATNGFDQVVESPHITVQTSN